MLLFISYFIRRRQPAKLPCHPGGLDYEKISESINDRNEAKVLLHATFSSGEPVTQGGLFGDAALKPGEMISRTIVLHVP